MAVPSSGTLSMKGIFSEKNENDYTAANMDGQSGLSLRGLSSNSHSDTSTGGNINLNSASASNPPNQTAPYSMSEFYSYDHDYAAATATLSYVNNRRTIGIFEEVLGSDSQARAYLWCYRTGTTIKIYARLQGNGSSAGTSAEGYTWTGLGVTGTQTELNTASSFHNVNLEFAQITNVDSGYKVGFTDAAVTGKPSQHAAGEVTSQNMTNSSSPTTTVSTTFWTASAGSSTQNTPPAGINYVRYESDAEQDASDTGYDRVTLHFNHATLTDFDVVVDIETYAEGIEDEPHEEDCPECCIHESMLIATEEDMKSIHDIKIGDKVISYNFETQSNELVEVEDLITIERDVDYKVNNLILTEDHPVYLNTGKKASINPEATLLNYKQEVDQIQIGDIMVKLDGTEEVIESIEKYEGTHLNYAIKTKHNNFYADGILVDSVILEKK